MRRSAVELAELVSQKTDFDGSVIKIFVTDFWLKKT